MAFLETNKITVLYEEEPVIQDISISINKGEMVGLLGASGVGKTTFFNVLTGITKPKEGHVVFKGNDITGQEGIFGYMLQDDLLLPYKTVYENIAMPLEIQKKSKDESKSLIEPLLTLSGLSAHKEHYPSQLSGGLRQRTAFVRTLVLEREMLLLDEPFSNLDPLTKSKMQTWFLEMVKKLKLTVLFITHDVEEAYYLADRIYVMKGNPGKINEEDCLLIESSDKLEIEQKRLKKESLFKE